MNKRHGIQPGEYRGGANTFFIHLSCCGNKSMDIRIIDEMLCCLNRL